MSTSRPSLAEVNPMRSFEAERRRHLIEATIETVSEVGFKSASLGEIARRAGVSPGLFAHYFGDKDGLLEATLRFMATRLARATAARMRAARTPLERVLAVPESALAPEEFDPRTSAVWLAFWGQIMHSEPYRRVQTIYQQRMRSNLSHSLRALVAPERLEISVSFIAATIDGLWLQSHSMRGKRSDGAEARALVRQLVMTLIGENGTRREAVAHDLAGPQCGWTVTGDAGSTAWRETDQGERAEVLRRVADRLRGERRQIARLEARDTGRPVSDIAAHDIALAIRLFERAADAAASPVPDRVVLGAGTFGQFERSHLGSVETSAHWSAPLLLASQVAAPALGAGASVFARTCGRKSRSLARLAEILREAGAPAGAFTALGEVGGERLAEPNPFAAPRKSVVVVTEDADPRRAAALIVHGPRRWARSRPFSETLIFAASSIRQELTTRLKAEAALLEIGDPTAPQTAIGPLRDKDHLEQALSLIDAACEGGATLRLGGRAHVPAGRSRAAFLKATLLDQCRDDIAIARTPLFAPVFAVFSFDTETEAAERMRPFGPDLSLGVYCRDTERARGIARAAGVAVCRINDAGVAFSAAREDWAWPWTDAFETVGRTIVGPDQPGA